MKIFIFLLFIYSINTQFEDVITMDLELNTNNFYRIKNIDSDLKLIFNNITNISLMPIKYINLIRMILLNKQILYNCNSKGILIEKNVYETFFCERNTGYQDFNKLKLNINLNNYNISLKESELFYREGKYYYFNFLYNDNISNILISKDIIKKNINKEYYLRNLESENNNNENNENNENEKQNQNENNNNDNETYKNESNNKSQNKINNKPRIGWIGICLIIILSVIVLYVVYVLFRYYRRKKYQNPSFYYKITEEMFDDITPIE